MFDGKRLTGGFRLGVWTVKPQDGSLRSPDSSIRLEPLLMDLLLCLCSRPRQVISKQEVLERVWGGRLVSDESVKGSFYQLRKALGDNSRAPRFIETIPKRGYRLLAEPAPLDSTGYYEKARAALGGEPNPASLKQARLYLERAIEDDPNHAAALAALARTYGLTIGFGLARGGEVWPLAKAAGTRAIELDPSLPDARLALSVVRAVYDHDVAAAEAESKAALELNPEDPATRRWRARLLSCLARHAEATAEIQRVAAADPLSVPACRDLIEILFMALRYDDAIAESQRLFDFAPAAADVHLGMVWLYYVRKQPEEAFEAFLCGLEVLGVAPRQTDQARNAFRSGGMTAILRLWAGWLEQQAEIGQSNQNDLMGLYALLGDQDRSFALIDQALENGNPFLLWLPVSPLFDNLRGDPRYGPLLARLGFSQPFPNR